MAAFDQIRLLYLKKDLICTLLILKRRKFARQKGKRVCWVRKIRSSRWQMLLNIAVIDNFSNFTGKYLCLSLFFNNVAGLQLYYKRLYYKTLVTLLQETLFIKKHRCLFSCEICNVFNNTFFYRTLPVAASGKSI